MNRHPTELVGALVDGELRGLRRWFLQRHVRDCPLCGAEYRHVQHVRRLLAENPVRPEMTDPPDFFWSKVRQNIERPAPQDKRTIPPRLSLADWLWWRHPSLATATVAVAVAVVVGWWAAGRSGSGPVAQLSDPGHPVKALVARPVPTPPASAKAIALVEKVSTGLPDAAVTALPGPEPDVAVIWVSGAPWAADMSAMMTHFANPDS